MTITRGLSQALFSFLPDQTADLEGGVWQVTNWADARFVAVDDDVVRREVARAAYPWTAANADSGLADHLLARREMQVITPSDSGVEVSRFPELFRCKNCGRPRGFIRKFSLCRICFRKFALAGEVPGVTKASW